MIVEQTTQFSSARRRQQGAALAIVAMTIGAILFLIFSVLQLTHGVARSLKTTYVALNTIQKMQGSIPYEQGAYDSALWVAELNGFNGTAATGAPQQISAGQFVDFDYVDRTNPLPDLVSAEYRDRLGLLNGLFNGLAGATGLVNLDTRALLRGTSGAPLLEVAADISGSMLGPLDPNNSVPIGNFLERYNIPADQDGVENADEFCYPLRTHYSSSELSALRLANPDLNPVDDAIAELELCWLYRAQLPVFYSEYRAMAHMATFDRKPEVYDPGINSTLPARNYAANPTLAPPYLCGPEVDPANPGAVGIELNFPGFRLVPRNYQACGGPSSAPCSPYGDGSGPGQSKILSDGGVDSALNPKFGYFNFDDLCILPWQVTGPGNTDRSWMTVDEANWCFTLAGAGGSFPPEMGGPACGTQRMALNFAYGDFYQTFNRLTQAFVIGASDLAPYFRFGVFAGVSLSGSVRLATQPARSPDPSISPSGHLLLFDGLATPGHIYNTSISLQSLLQRTYGTQPVETLLAGSYNVGQLRMNHMLAYLDPDIYPTLNPQSTNPLAITPAHHSFVGSQAYFPLDHPQYTTSSRPGRSGTYSHNLPRHPTEGIYGGLFRLSYSWNLQGDMLDPGANQFFPSPRAFEQMFIGTNPVFSDSFYTALRNNAPAGYDGRYSLQPLKAVDTNGVVITPPQDYTPETSIRNTAPSVFNYLRPAGGGTDTWGATWSFADGCQRHKINQGADAKCIAVMITDGAPEASGCTLTDPPLPNQVLACDTLDSASHRQRVAAELARLEAMGNTTVVVLFLQQGTPSADVQAFLDMFLPTSPLSVNPNPRGRLLITFPVGTPAQFAARYGDGLKLVSAVIRNETQITR